MPENAHLETPTAPFARPSGGPDLPMLGGAFVLKGSIATGLVLWGDRLPAAADRLLALDVATAGLPLGAFLVAACVWSVLYWITASRAPPGRTRSLALFALYYLALSPLGALYLAQLGTGP